MGDAWSDERNRIGENGGMEQISITALVEKITDEAKARLTPCSKSCAGLFGLVTKSRVQALAGGMS